VLSATLRVLPVHLSVRLSRIRARNSTTIKRRKIEINLDVPDGMSKWNANFQLKRSKAKVT